MTSFDNILNRIEAAQDAERKAKSDLFSAVRQFLLEDVSSQDRLDRAHYVYWNLKQVPVSEIAECVLGTTKVHKLLELLPRGYILTCSKCGGQVEIWSRSQACEFEPKKRPKAIARSHKPLCEACKQVDSAEREAAFEVLDYERALRFNELQAMPYREYLGTEEWMEIRRGKLRQARHRCQLCNSEGVLNVHHRTYDQPRGQEYMNDLIVLCQPCHAKFHDKLPAEPSESLVTDGATGRIGAARSYRERESASHSLRESRAVNNAGERAEASREP